MNRRTIIGALAVAAVTFLAGWHSKPTPNAIARAVNATDGISGNDGSGTFPANHAFTCAARPNSTLLFPVPSMRPVQGSSVCGFDIHPNGTPTPNATNGVTWIDVMSCDLTGGDQNNTNPPGHSGRIGMMPNVSGAPGWVYVGHANWNGAQSNVTTRIDLQFGVNSTAMWSINYNGVLYPNNTSYQIGSGSNYCAAVYSAGYYVVSDAKEKTLIDDGEIPAGVLRAVKSVKLKQYHYVKDKKQLKRFGPLAQDIEAAFAKEGLKADDYALFQRDPETGILSVDLMQFHLLRSMAP